METLRDKFLRHVGQTSPGPMMVEVARAEGVFFYSPDGKRYYDLIAGVTVNNVGHANPAVVEAVRRQAGEYMHVMVYGEMIERPQVRYAEKIASLLPAGLDSVYFLNSGSEAVEGALKLAKRYTGRTELVSFRGSYHGSTHGSLSVIGGEELKNAFRPLLPDTRLLDFNDFDGLRHITHRTAAVIVEPVQSEGGVTARSSRQAMSGICRGSASSSRTPPSSRKRGASTIICLISSRPSSPPSNARRGSFCTSGDNPAIAPDGTYGGLLTISEKRGFSQSPPCPADNALNKSPCLN